MKKKIFATALALAATIGLAFAQVGPGYHTFVQWQKFLGKVIFVNTVEFQGETTFSGTTADLTLTDDLVVGDDATIGDDAAITGDLSVTGTSTISGGVVSPLVLSTSKARIYHGTTTLTEAGGAETVFTLTTATTQATGGIVYYRITASDATDYQASTGMLVLSMVNKGGTVTATVLPADTADGVTAKTAVQALSSGTATNVFANTAGANSAVFSVNIDSSLTTTSASMEWTLVLLGPGTLS